MQRHAALRRRGDAGRLRISLRLSSTVAAIHATTNDVRRSVPTLNDPRRADDEAGCADIAIDRGQPRRVAPDDFAAVQTFDAGGQPDVTGVPPHDFAKHWEAR